MRITEIIKNIYCYAAVIRAKQANTTLTVKTVIWANGILEARTLLAAMYGADSVVSVTRVTQDQLSEAVPNGTQRQALPTLLPNVYKHELAQKTLVNQMKLNSLRVKPTIDDLEVARSDHEAAQKRVNREYDSRLKWAAIRKRRLQRF